MISSFRKIEKSHYILIAVIAINIAALCWAGNIITGRLLRNEITPLLLTFLRFLVAFICFLPILLKRQTIQEIRSYPVQLIVMSLCGVVIFPLLVYKGLQNTTALNASLLNGTTPLFTLLVASLWERRAPSLRIQLATLCSLAAIAVLIFGQKWGELGSLKIETYSGDLLIIVSVFCWACYSVIGRKIPINPIRLSAINVAIGFPLILFLCFFGELQKLHLSLNIIIGAIYLGVFATLIALILWNYGLKLIGPVRAGFLFNLVPFYGVLLSYLFMEETIGKSFGLGLALMIVGALLGSNLGNLGTPSQKQEKTK